MTKLHPEAVEEITFSVDWNGNTPSPAPGSVDVSFDQGITWHETDDGVLLVAGPYADDNDGVTLELGRTVPLLRWISGDQVIIRRSDEAIDVGHAPTVSEVDDNEGGGGGQGEQGEPGEPGAPGADGNTILNGAGPPASGTGLDPVNGADWVLDDLDGVNDPWRWCEGQSAWVGPAFEVTWAEDDETPAFDRPLSSNELSIYLGPWSRMQESGTEATWVYANQAFPVTPVAFLRDSDDLPGTSNAGVLLTTGTGIAFLTQTEPGYTHTMVPDANVDITTMLGDITVGDQWEPGPWRWHPGFGAWVGPAYEVTWSEGDVVPAYTTPAGVPTGTLATFIATESTLAGVFASTTGSFDQAGGSVSVGNNFTGGDNIEDFVAIEDGAGYAFLTQNDPGSGPTRVGEPDLDLADYLGDVVQGDAYEWPETSTGRDGDWYIEHTDSPLVRILHGPKADGSWPEGVSLIGPEGPAGP